MVATVLIAILVAGGIWLIFDLQRHLARTRTIIDPDDKNPFWRGISIVIGLAFALGIGAVAVVYFLWRG
jgi:hypothetical protein